MSENVVNPTFCPPLARTVLRTLLEIAKKEKYKAIGTENYPWALIASIFEGVLETTLQNCECRYR